MTVASETSKVQYNGDGATTDFSVTFKYTAKTQIVVVHTDSAGVETTWVLGTQYTLTDPGSSGTLTVETTPTDYRPASGETLTIYRDVDFTQVSDYTTGGGLTAEGIESDLDTRVFQIQRLREMVSRALLLPQSTGESDLAIPELVAGKGLAVNDDGDALEWADIKDIFVQNSAPSTSEPSGSLWIDADSADNDLYQLVSGVWTDTGVNLIGATGATGSTGSTGATGAQGDAAGVGFTFSTTTSMADPGSGNLRFNSGTIASVTAIAVDDANSDAVDVSAYVVTWDDSDSTIKGVLLVVKENDASVFAAFSVTGLTDNSGWTELAVTHLASGGSFSNSDSIRLQFFRTGDKGETGDTGATGSTGSTGAAGADGVNAGLTYAFNSGTSGDPGSGQFLANNATLSSATALNVSDTDGDSNDVSGWLATWDDSDHSIRGTVVVRDQSDTAAYAVFNITGASVDNSTYWTLSVTHVASAGTLSGACSIEFYRSGDDGADGAGSGDVVGPESAVDGNLASFDETTGKLIQDSGIAAANVVVDADIANMLETTDIGVSVQAYDAQLDEWSGVDPSENGKSLVSAADYAAMRALLDLEPNTDFYAPGGTDVPVADGGTGRSSHTAYAVLCGGTTSTGAQQSIASVGTSGQVLTSNGASALPTFQDAAGGGVVTAVESGALSSQATLDITLSTADLYEIDLINVIPETNSRDLQAQFSQSSTFISADYRWSMTQIGVNTATNADTQIDLFGLSGNDTGEGVTLTVRIFRPSASSFFKGITFSGFGLDGSGNVEDVVGGGKYMGNTNAIDGIRFKFLTGNIASGYYAVRSYSFT